MLGGSQRRAEALGLNLGSSITANPDKGLPCRGLLFPMLPICKETPTPSESKSPKTS